MSTRTVNKKRMRIPLGLELFNLNSYATGLTGAFEKRHSDGFNPPWIAAVSAASLSTWGALFEVTIPDNYVPNTDITLVAHAKANTLGNTTHQCIPEVGVANYEGAMVSNLVTDSAIGFTNTNWIDMTWNIPNSGANAIQPGDRLIILFKATHNDTGAGSETYVGDISLLYFAVE